MPSSTRKRRVRTIGHYETEAWNLIHLAERREESRMKGQQPGGLGNRHLFTVDLAAVIADALRKRDDQFEADMKETNDA